MCVYMCVCVCVCACVCACVCDVALCGIVLQAHFLLLSLDEAVNMGPVAPSQVATQGLTPPPACCLLPGARCLVTPGAQALTKPVPRKWSPETKYWVSRGDSACACKRGHGHGAVVADLGCKACKGASLAENG